MNHSKMPLTLKCYSLQPMMNTQDLGGSASIYVYNYRTNLAPVYIGINISYRIGQAEVCLTVLAWDYPGV